ncbi:MAG: DNA replication complex subunit Gins51 [Candidatus Heimdallarchaeaceae archaeon]
MFDKIQAKWKEEREKETLTPLNEAFYGAMRDFLKQRTIKTKEEINPFVKKMLEERLKRLKFVVNDLLKIRTIKIIRSVISKEEIKVNMAREELDFYDRMKKIYDIYRKEVFSPKDVAYTDIQSILDEEIIEEEQEKIEHVAIRFLKSTKDRIQGLDGQIYGPFEPEDVCLLPKENAIGFVRREIAENIDIN